MNTPQSPNDKNNVSAFAVTLTPQLTILFTSVVPAQGLDKSKLIYRVDDVGPEFFAGIAPEVTSILRCRLGMLASAGNKFYTSIFWPSVDSVGLEDPPLKTLLRKQMCAFFRSLNQDPRTRFQVNVVGVFPAEHLNGNGV